MNETRGDTFCAINKLIYARRSGIILWLINEFVFL